MVGIYTLKNLIFNKIAYKKHYASFFLIQYFNFFLIDIILPQNY